MRRKMVSVVLSCCLALILLPVTAAATEPEANAAPPIPTTGDVWDGTATHPSKLVQKDGVTYYEITKCAELAYVAQEGGDWLTYNYILANNLILNDVVITWDENGNCTNDPGTLHEWTPIGNYKYEDRFTGKFEGGGYIVSGLYVNTPEKIIVVFLAMLI